MQLQTLSCDRKRIRLSRGFSILELTVTLALVGVVIAAAVPSIASASRRLHLASEATALRLFIERAYAHSLAYQDRVTIRLTEFHAAAHVENGRIIGNYTLLHAVRMDLTPRRELILQANPTISISPATVILRLGTESCSVVVSLRGRVRTTC